MKSILLHIHDDVGADSRQQAACDLARAYDAHVHCVQVTPLPDLVAADVYGGAGYAPSIAAELHEIDEAYRTKMEARLGQEDIAWDWRQIDGDSVAGLLSAARLSDVIVATLPEGGRVHLSDPLPIVADLALGGRTPVLAVPQACKGFAVTWPRKGRAVDVALQEAIGTLAADWVVMGAFGHSRWRELVFGGVTRAMLRDTRVPLLLAH